MLTLYTARTVREGADKVLSDISKQDGRHVVIVPDPFTLAVETAVAERLGEKGVFDVEVMSFARLAAVTLGTQIKKCLSPAGSVMLMEKVIRSHEAELEHFARAARKAGFAAEMYAAITALRNSGVEPDRLREAADGLMGYLAKKTREIALLYSAYLEELTKNHADSTTRLESLVEAIEHPERFSRPLGFSFGDVRFHVIDHVDLNYKQRQVVLALAKHARSVDVAVAVPNGADNARVFPSLASDLEKMAAGLPLEKVPVPLGLTGDRARIANELFAYSYSKGDPTDVVSLVSAKDMTEEVTFLATEITRLVRGEGLRYADVAVITPSFSEYLPFIERIFPYYDIPFFADARYPLSETSLFLHVMRALRIVEKRGEQTQERAFVTHPFFTRVSVTDKAAFCDYLDKAGVTYRDPCSPFTLFDEDPLFPQANVVLAALAEELDPLLSLPNEAEVSLYTERIKTFLVSNDYAARLTDYAASLTGGASASAKAAVAKQAEILRRSLPALVELLDTMREIRGTDVVSLADLLVALTAGAGQVKLAALPVSLDSVYFANVEQAMYAPIKRLFVIGAEETLFPLEKVKDGIIGPPEYGAWQSTNVEIKVENTGKEELKASKFHVLQLLLRAEKTTLSHVGGKLASPCIGQLSVMFATKEKPCAKLLCGEEYTAEVLIPTETVAGNMLVEYARKEKEGLLTPVDGAFYEVLADLVADDAPSPSAAEERLSAERAEEVFFRKKTVDKSELESYFYCPFVHFVRYGLGAKEKEVAERDARDVGNLAHDCMEIFVRDHVMRRPKGAIDGDEADRIAREIAAKLVEDKPRYQAIKEREGARVMAREIARCGKVAVRVKDQIYASAFEPRFFERSFGSTGGVNAFPRTLRLDGLRFKGRMDRVDVLSDRRTDDGREFVSVLDYKTGSNAVTAEELYMGSKVQLPLYLEVLAASGYEPVAALYASLKENLKGDVYLVGPKNGEKGVTADLDESILDGKSSYTGMEIKNGAPEGKLLLSDEVFRAIRSYVLMLTEQAIREIRSGCVAPSPLVFRSDRSPCKECKERNVCRHADALGRDKVKGVKEEDLLTIVKKGENEG